MGLFDALFKPNIKKLKEKRDVEELIKSLSYEKGENVREAAAKALGEIKDTRAVEPLIATLKDAVKYVREAVAEALGKIKDVKAVEPLIVALNDRSEDVRNEAAKALGEINDFRAVEPLILVLNGGGAYAYVRNAAAEALGKIGNPRAVEPLILALKDCTIREAAAWALGKINDPKAVAALKDFEATKLVKKVIDFGEYGETDYPANFESNYHRSNPKQTTISAMPKSTNSGKQTTFKISERGMVVFRPLRKINWPDHCVGCYSENPTNKIKLDVYPATKTSTGSKVGGVAGAFVGSLAGTIVGGIASAAAGETSEYMMPICNACLAKLSDKERTALATSEYRMITSSPPIVTQLLLREFKSWHVILTFSNKKYAIVFADANPVLVFDSIEEAKKGTV